MRGFLLASYRRAVAPFSGRGFRRFPLVDRTHRFVTEALRPRPEEESVRARAPGEPLSFLRRYQEALERIDGWFVFDAAILFMAYAQLLRARGVAGDTLEIGVHHGRSAIAVASLRGEGRRFVAIDLFEELQHRNVSRSGRGSREIFLDTMRGFYPDLGFLTVIGSPSASVSAETLGSGFSVCHIDGGHSFEETYADLSLCARISHAGGLIALDDYFTPGYPGVAEAASAFERDHPGSLLPVAIGFNKVLFQRGPAHFDLNRDFAAAFPDVPRGAARLWRRDVPLFLWGFAACFDLDRWSGGALVHRPLRLDAELRPLASPVHGARATRLRVPVRVRNRSSVAFGLPDAPLALSYHLRSTRGEDVRYDNRRTSFPSPIPPGGEEVVELLLDAPEQPGTYHVEADVVWEGFAWFKDRGSATAGFELIVR